MNDSLSPRQVTLQCKVCLQMVARPEQATIPCDIRQFKNDNFVVWRCPHCRSIHARDEVDLDKYYADYPFLRVQLDLPVRLTYWQTLRRLRRGGLAQGHRVLDYGCGSGAFVCYLRERGYDATGYDAYSEAFRDPSALERRYDCVVAQDVIEHVPEPLALLAELSRLTVPGGLVAIGTPDAAAIDLKRVEDCVHMLHMPYHRHIFSSQALQQAAGRHGWKLLKHHLTAPSNLPLPLVNLRFALHYFRIHDDTLDLAFEPPKFSWKLLTPKALFFALFGYFFCPTVDVTSIFRTAGVRELS